MLQSHGDLVSPHQRTQCQFHSHHPATNETREAEFKSRVSPMFLMLLMLPLTWHGGPEFGGANNTWDIPESTKALGKTLIELNALEPFFCSLGALQPWISSIRIKKKLGKATNHHDCFQSTRWVLSIIFCISPTWMYQKWRTFPLVQATRTWLVHHVISHDTYRAPLKCPESPG